MTFSRSDLHPKKEHSRCYVTDEGGNMDRKDFQRWCRLFFEDYLVHCRVIRNMRPAEFAMSCALWVRLWMLRGSPRIWFFAPPLPWPYGGCCLWRGRILWLSNSRGYSVSCRGLLAVLRGWSFMPPMHLRDKVCKGFLLVAQLLLRPPLLDGGYFLRSPGCVSCRSFLQKRKTCVEFLLLQRWHPVRHSLGGRSPFLTDSSILAILRAFHACWILAASRLAWRSIAISCSVFLFIPKKLVTFASALATMLGSTPFSRVEPRLRKADTLWKSSGFILRGVL